MNKKEEIYESPSVNIVEVTVEQGFAASGSGEQPSEVDIEKYDLVGTFNL